MSESSDTFKVTCQQCGMEMDYLKVQLDLSLRVTCKNCGHALTADAPSSLQIVDAARDLWIERMPSVTEEPWDIEH